MSEKQIGVGLLGIGIFIMFASVVIVVLLLTGIIKPVKVFDIPAPSINTSSLMPSVPGLPAPKGEKVEILPTAAFSQIINTSIQFLMMTFIMSFGFKLADLGVKLLRPIKIEAKT